MSPNEAAELLGVLPTASGDEVQRAYGARLADAGADERRRDALTAARDALLAALPWRAPGAPSTVAAPPAQPGPPTALPPRTPAPAVSGQPSPAEPPAYGGAAPVSPVAGQRAFDPPYGQATPGQQAPGSWVSGPPVYGRPVPGPPVYGQPAPAQPAPAQPVPGQPVPGQPAPGQLAPAQPVPAQPAPGQPAPGHVAYGHPSPGQPAAAHAAPAQPTPTYPPPFGYPAAQAVPGQPTTWYAPPPPPPRKGMSTGAIVGITLGGIAAALVVLLVAVFALASIGASSSRLAGAGSTSSATPSEGPSGGTAVQDYDVDGVHVHYLTGWTFELTPSQTCAGATLTAGFADTPDGDTLGEWSTTLDLTSGVPVTFTIPESASSYSYAGIESVNCGQA